MHRRRLQNRYFEFSRHDITTALSGLDSAKNRIEKKMSGARRGRVGTTADGTSEACIRKKGKGQTQMSDENEGDGAAAPGDKNKQNQQQFQKYKLDQRAVSKALPVVVKATLSSLQAARDLGSVAYDVALIETEARW